MNLPSRKPQDQGLQWMKLAEGWLKINWDASVDSTRRRIEVGVVVRDHEGVFVAAKIITCPCILDPTMA
jgi:hypothetical protein